MLIRPYRNPCRAAGERRRNQAAPESGRDTDRRLFLSTPQLYDFIDTYIAKRLHLFQAVQQPYHFPKVASVEGKAFLCRFPAEKEGTETIRRGFRIQLSFHFFRSYFFDNAFFRPGFPVKVAVVFLIRLSVYFMKTSIFCLLRIRKAWTADA